MNTTPPEAEFSFILEEFAERTPGQQLLDRFLIGYNAAGEFRAPAKKVTLYAQNVANKEALQARVTEFGLVVASSVNEAAVASANCIVAGEKRSQVLPDTLTRAAMEAMRSDGRVYVYGVPENIEVSGELANLAERKNLRIGCGTMASAPFQLPELSQTDFSGVAKGLIVAVGDFPGAEIEALEGIHSVVRSRPRTTQVHVRALPAKALWQAVYSSYWNELFAGAMSRSTTVQGDPERDGRTQDIAGLHLVEQLAANARGWLLQQRGGELLIAVVDGAVKDFNVALQMKGGRVVSTQLYRPPGPMSESFSRLAQSVEEFLLSDGEVEFPGLEYIPQVLDAMREAAKTTISSTG